jgi:hypothetical protein
MTPNTSGFSVVLQQRGKVRCAKGGMRCPKYAGTTLADLPVILGNFFAN